MTSQIQYRQFGDLRIAYQRLGGTSPAPLVFLHGLGDSSIITFRRIAAHPALAGVPALLVDLPGFGHSTAPDSWPATIEQHAGSVAHLLDHLGVTSAPITGHSMGANVALVLATTRPDLPSRLILAEPLLRNEQSELARTIARRRESDFSTRGFDMLQRATRRQASRGNAAALGFIEPLARANPSIMYRSAISLLADRSPSFLDMLQNSPLPRTLLVGEHTEVASGLVPDDVRLVRIPQAGHSMMSENPDAYAKAVASACGFDDGEDWAGQDDSDTFGIPR